MKNTTKEREKTKKILLNGHGGEIIKDIILCKKLLNSYFFNDLININDYIKNLYKKYKLDNIYDVDYSYTFQPNEVYFYIFNRNIKKMVCDKILKLQPSEADKKNIIYGGFFNLFRGFYNVEYYDIDLISDYDYKIEKILKLFLLED